MIERVFHTFSIVARCPRTGSFGVAVSTARPAVGAAVPWTSARGAVATQAKTNTELGRRALALLDQDVSVGVALDALLDGDPERDRRQAHGVAADGVFAHTGQECVTWCGDRAAVDFSVAGNMLAGPQVLDAMAAALLVWSSDPRPYHNLRVDDHADPVAELRRLHDLAVTHTETLLEQYGAEGLRRYRRVKG